jgi:hypothetical protein
MRSECREVSAGAGGLSRLVPLCAGVLLAKEVLARGVVPDFLDEIGITQQVLCKNSVNNQERCRLAISFVVAVAIQGFDVQVLMLASQFQDELVACEGFWHLSDLGWVVSV